MNKLINKILTEWAYRVHNGMPNIKNTMHILHLQETLDELRIPRKVSEKLLQNLRKIEEDWWDDASKKRKASYIKKHGGPPHSRSGKTDTKTTKKTGTPDEKPTKVKKDKEEPKQLEPPESEDDIQARMDKDEKNERKHLLKRLDIDVYKETHPDATEEEIEHLKDLKIVLMEFTHPDTTPERKKELAQHMKEKYGLTTNIPTTVDIKDENGNVIGTERQDVKLYIKKNHDGGGVPRRMEKLLTTPAGHKSGIQSRIVDELNEHGGEVTPNTIGGKSEKKVAQEFTTAAKPDFKTEKRTKNRQIAPPGARKKKDEKTGEYYYLDKDGNKKPFYRKDPTVSKIFDGDNALADLEDKEPGDENYHSLEGPVDKNGDIIPTDTAAGQNTHLDFHINENLANQRIKDKCDEYINHPDTSPADKEKFKKLKKGIEDYERDMNKIKDMPPGPEKAKKVKAINAKLMDDVYSAHPDIAGGIGKQIAENALVTEELAAGEEVYMPSAGNFPGGDKIKIIRDEAGIEMVAGVSIKFGRSSPETQIHGFPAQADSMSRFAVPKRKKLPNPNYDPKKKESKDNPKEISESDEDYKKRKTELRTRSGQNVGQDNYSNGVRDDIVKEKPKQQEIIENSGMGKVVPKDRKVPNPNYDPKKKESKDNPKEISARDEFFNINNEIKTEVDNFKTKCQGKNPTKEKKKWCQINLQKHIKGWMEKNKIQDRLDKCIDRKELMKQLTGTEDGTYLDKDGKRRTHSNEGLARKSDPMETLAIFTLGATIKEGQGLPGLDYNHQRYEDGEYHSATVGPNQGDDMTNLANYGMSSRMYRTEGRTGGTILSTGTGEFGRKIVPGQKAQTGKEEPTSPDLGPDDMDEPLGAI